MATLKESKPVYLLNWSEVLNEIKKGKRFTREGWNGKNLHVMLTGRLTDEKSGLRIEPFFIIVDASGKSNAWVPSTSDLLSEDWVEV